jgi:glycosyltransferase involved in cell wall biosynthesis
MTARRTRRARVLVIKCCRTSRVLDAVRMVRRRFPTAEVVVLCHASAAREVADSGLGDIVTYASRRLGIVAAADALLHLRRRSRFDSVVIPYMVPDHVGHANVLRLAVTIDAPETVILSGDEPQSYGRAGLRRLALRASVQSIARWFDIPVLLMAMAAASLVPWRRSAAAANRRKVLHIVTGLGAGGAQVQIAELIARTPVDDYQVDILVLAPHEGRFSLQSAAWPDVRVRVYESWPNLTGCFLHIYRLCRRERYDIVHTWLFYANVIGAAAARLAGVPRIIASVRNMSLWKRAWYNRPWFRIADALGSRAADIVTVNSPALVEDHSRWAWYPAARIQVVPNGLSPDTLVPMRDADRARVRREFGWADDALVVGTVGRLAPEKDQATFLRIIAALHSRTPQLRAVIVGGGDSEPGLRNLRRELDLDQVVVFAGERADARFLIGGFDLLLLTSRCEGLPNVLLEAAFLEVPSVSSDTGGASDIIESNCLFAPGDVEGGTQSAAASLNDRIAARDAAVRTRARAMNQFTSARAAAEWLALYDQVKTGEAA